MKTSNFYAKAQPSWTNQWPNGSVIMWPRGPGMSACERAWQDTFIAQVVQLAQMGFEALYFDEYPAEIGGDWSPACRARFRATYGEEMPTAHTEVTEKQGTHPLAADRRILAMMSNVTEEYFERLAAAVERARPSSAALVSVFRVPVADNGLYETTRLMRPTNVVAKSEDHIPMNIKPPPSTDTFDDDVMKAFGLALVRDAATDAVASLSRPAHIWLPALNRSQDATCASTTCVAYGAIANPDHHEKDVPNHKLYDETYALAANLSAAWTRFDQPLVPLAYASVLFSESARNQHMPADAPSAWAHVLFPSLGAWHALVRARRPAKLLVDYQLLEWPAARLVALHPSLITPPQAALTHEARLAIAAYVAAGGQLVEASDDPGWGSAAARVALEASLLAAVDAASAEPPRARLLGAEDSAAHLVAYTSGREGLLLFVLNNFTGCFGGSTAPAPAPLSGLSIEFRLPPTAFPERAMDAITGTKLRLDPQSAAAAPGASVWRVPLPPIAMAAAVTIDIRTELGPLSLAP